MSIHPPDGIKPTGAPQLGGAVATLVQEITRLKLDLEVRRVGLSAAPEAQEAQKLTSVLRDIVQWIGIAIEVEETYEKQFRGPKPDTPTERNLDLDAARASIGGKLDRLRAAAGAERLSGQPE
ncbi:hypothetical protein [Lentibacter sp.]|uniref:hypothetical protein n=1 Tax=Lentibacter sp. TaxID=2024994 RepID=UPI003F6A013F